MPNHTFFGTFWQHIRLFSSHGGHFGLTSNQKLTLNRACYQSVPGKIQLVIFKYQHSSTYTYSVQKHYVHHKLCSLKPSYIPLYLTWIAKVKITTCLERHSISQPLFLYHCVTTSEESLHLKNNKQHSPVTLQLKYLLYYRISIFSLTLCHGPSHAMLTELSSALRELQFLEAMVFPRELIRL